MRVSRRHGRLTMRLEPGEVRLLDSMLDDLEAVIGSTDADDGAAELRNRLFPPAYLDDETAEADFRDLTETTLRAERDERIGACRAQLAAGRNVDLSDPEVGRRWIQVLNDLRLAYGTRLGVSEEDDPRIDPTAPDAELRAVYHWLTAVQDAVVQALMR